MHGKSIALDVLRIHESRVRTFFRQFFGMQAVPRERVQQSLGSGVIVDARQGLVLTNNHVVDGADDIAVTLVPSPGSATLMIGALALSVSTDFVLAHVPLPEWLVAVAKWQWP